MLRLHLNESPYQIPGDLLARALDPASLELNRYPDLASAALRELYAGYANRTAAPSPLVTAEHVVPFNGGDEAIDTVILALRSAVRQVIIMPPTFGEYARAARVAGVSVVEVPLTPAFAIDLAALVAAASRAPSLVFICSPNNPTGNLVDTAAALEALGAVRPAPWVVIDEAYWEFAGTNMLPALGRYPDLVILRTMSKAFCLAGLRLGFALGRPETVRLLDRTRMVFNIDALAASVGRAALLAPGYASEVVAQVTVARQLLAEGLSALTGVVVHPSSTNFVLCRTPYPAADVSAAMERRGILIRHYRRAPELTNDVRISVGTPEEVARCVAAMADCLAELDGG